MASFWHSKSFYGHHWHFKRAINRAAQFNAALCRALKLAPVIHCQFYIASFILALSYVCQRTETVLHLAPNAMQTFDNWMR